MFNKITQQWAAFVLAVLFAFFTLTALYIDHGNRVAQNQLLQAQQQLVNRANQYQRLHQQIGALLAQSLQRNDDASLRAILQQHQNPHHSSQAGDQ